MIDKIVKIQKELKAPKSNYNSFGKYSYRSCEDILEAIKPLLQREGIMQTITDEVMQIGDRYYIKATVTVTDGEKEHSVSALARESESRKGQDDSQITGTASSYARKYALNGLWLIDDTKDADSNEGTQEAEGRNQSAPQASGQAKPAMTPSHNGWKKAVNAVAQGKYTINQIKSKYALSERDEAMMRSQIQRLMEGAIA